MSETLAPDELLPVEFSDDALTAKFATAHGDKFRYVAKWGQWFRYDGKRWLEDETIAIFDLVRKECRKVAANSGSNSGKNAQALSSGKTVAAVERMARADRAFAATTSQWDSDQWALNTPAGVVNLRSGLTRAHRPEDYHSKMTAVAPGGDCPIFREFLEQITAGDSDLQAFMQRLFGYSLTGVTREQMLAFFYGKGANGKSVLLGTIANILGDYSTAAPIETFTASNFDRHPTELAGLRGARLVTATETDEGRQWAEARIKALTGGDKITARFMRQDFFEFTPQFKLVIAGNHLPGLRAVDEAIRRRFHLVPFTVTIPPEQRDPNLSERLKAEWPGILRWVIDGCLSWQDNGLAPPEAVTKATAHYLEAEDAMAQWIAERCLTDEPDAWESSSTLFADWQEWARRAGEPARTQKRFSNDLENRGFTSERRRTGRGFQRIRLMPQMAAWVGE